MTYWPHSNPDPAVHEPRRPRRRRDIDPSSLSPCVNPRCQNRDDDGNIEPVETVFCRKCTTRIRRELIEIAELYVELHCELTPGQSGGLHTSGTKEVPLPINTRNRALMEDIVKEVTALADRIRAARHGRVLKPSEHPGRRQRESRHLSRSINLLSTELHFALDKHPDGADTGLRILNLNHRARATLGWTRYVKHYEGLACPDCDLKALGQAAGTESVQCRNCGAHWPASHIKALVGIVARELIEAEGA